MKYANLCCQTIVIDGSKIRSVNIGDMLQFLVIDYIYQEMKIKKEDVVYLSLDELSTYQGEYVVLPLNWCLFDDAFMVEEKISISSHVIPVFLGMTICSRYYKEEYFNEYNISYLKQYEPIGCRDEYTMKKLQQYGIRAYLNGCLTAVFPKRNSNSIPSKVFAVDAPAEIQNYMPKDLYEECETLTQQYYYELNVQNDIVMENVKQQYKKYAEEAKLIITSRLHVASPCMAMGIPVIFARNKIDARFGWLDKLLPLYDYRTYGEINWNPERVEYEDFKYIILENAKKRIEETMQKHKKYCSVSELFEKKQLRNFVTFEETVFNNFDKAQLFLEKKYSTKDEFFYSIWGINSAAENFYNYMNHTYPYAKLKNAIDTYKKGQFHEVSIIEPQELNISEDEVIIVVAVKASNFAEEFFKAKGISKNQYICSGDVFLQKN